MRFDWEKNDLPNLYFEPWAKFSDHKNTVMWALDFVQKDLSTLTRGEHIDLQADIYPFCSLYEIPVVMEPHPQDAVWPEREIRALQEELLNIFRTFIREGYIEIDVEQSKMKAGVFKEGPRKGRSYLSEQTRSYEPSIEQGMRRLVRAFGEVGHLLKECEAPESRSVKEDLKCERLFMSKKNQTYCSPTCQNRASTQASRRTITHDGHRIRGTSVRSPDHGRWVPSALILTPKDKGGDRETEVPPHDYMDFKTRQEADQFAYELAKEVIWEIDAKHPQRGI